MSPQNMLLWHTDSFELKVLEKLQMQEGLSDLHFYTEKQAINEKGALPVPERQERSYHQSQNPH